MEFTLNAADLVKRHGFSDAMIFFDVLDEGGLPDDLDEMQLVETLSAMGGLILQDNPEQPTGTSLHEVVLYRVVERKLMPKLLGFTLVLDPLNSNSVRLKEGWPRHNELVISAIKDISVTVSSDEILSVANEVVTAYNLKNDRESSIEFTSLRLF